MTIGKAIARAWSDSTYKARLLSNPPTALAEIGVEIPAGTTINVVENTAGTQYLVLPVSPANASELSIEDLEKVAGGASINTNSNAMSG